MSDVRVLELFRWGSTSGAGTACASEALEWGLHYGIFSFLCSVLSINVYFCPLSFGHYVVWSSIYGFWYFIGIYDFLLAREEVIYAKKKDSDVRCGVFFVSYVDDNTDRSIVILTQMSIYLL